MQPIGIDSFELYFLINGHTTKFFDDTMIESTIVTPIITNMQPYFIKQLVQGSAIDVSVMNRKKTNRAINSSSIMYHRLQNQGHAKLYSISNIAQHNSNHRHFINTPQVTLDLPHHVIIVIFGYHQIKVTSCTNLIVINAGLRYIHVTATPTTLVIQTELTQVADTAVIRNIQAIMTHQYYEPTQSMLANGSEYLCPMSKITTWNDARVVIANDDLDVLFHPSIIRHYIQATSTSSPSTHQLPFYISIILDRQVKYQAQVATRISSSIPSKIMEELAKCINAMSQINQLVTETMQQHASFHDAFKSTSELSSIATINLVNEIKLAIFNRLMQLERLIKSIKSSYLMPFATYMYLITRLECFVGFYQRATTDLKFKYYHSQVDGLIKCKYCSTPTAQVIPIITQVDDHYNPIEYTSYLYNIDRDYIKIVRYFPDYFASVVFPKSGYAIDYRSRCYVIAENQSQGLPCVVSIQNNRGYVTSAFVTRHVSTDHLNTINNVYSQPTLATHNIITHDYMQAELDWFDDTTGATNSAILPIDDQVHITGVESCRHYDREFQSSEMTDVINPIIQINKLFKTQNVKLNIPIPSIPNDTHAVITSQLQQLKIISQPFFTATSLPTFRVNTPLGQQHHQCYSCSTLANGRCFHGKAMTSQEIYHYHLYIGSSLNRSQVSPFQHYYNTLDPYAIMYFAQVGDSKVFDKCPEFTRWMYDRIPMSDDVLNSDLFEIDAVYEISSKLTRDIMIQFVPKLLQGLVFTNGISNNDFDKHLVRIILIKYITSEIGRITSQSIQYVPTLLQLVKSYQLDHVQHVQSWSRLFNCSKVYFPLVPSESSYNIKTKVTSPLICSKCHKPFIDRKQFEFIKAASVQDVTALISNYDKQIKAYVSSGTSCTNQVNHKTTAASPKSIQDAIDQMVCNIMHYNDTHCHQSFDVKHLVVTPSQLVSKYEHESQLNMSDLAYCHKDPRTIIEQASLLVKQRFHPNTVTSVSIRSIPSAIIDSIKVHYDFIANVNHNPIAKKIILQHILFCTNYIDVFKGYRYLQLSQN